MYTVGILDLLLGEMAPSQFNTFQYQLTGLSGVYFFVRAVIRACLIAYDWRFSSVIVMFAETFRLLQPNFSVMNVMKLTPSARQNLFSADYLRHNFQLPRINHSWFKWRMKQGNALWDKNIFSSIVLISWFHSQEPEWWTSCRNDKLDQLKDIWLCLVFFKSMQTIFLLWRKPNK